MSYVEEHLDWLRSFGLPVLALSDAESLHPELRVAQRTLDAMPSEVAEWYTAMPFARGAHAALALPGSQGALTPPHLPDLPDPDEVPDLARYQDQGRFPLRPAFFATTDHMFMVVETIGERAGWLYAYSYPDLDVTITGPFAESIPQYLAAIRRLVDLGLLAVGSNPAWVVEETSAEAPWPPNDSPGPLFGLDHPRFSPDNCLHLEAGVPIASSICDILPDFTIVTIDD